MSTKQFGTIDEYIDSFPKEVKILLEKMRQTIKKAAPEATETISYGIPTFKLNGKNLVHFGGFKDHTSFFPGGSPIENAIPEVAKYRTGKGTLQFPLDKPIPMSLISKIVKFRVQEIKDKK